MLALVWPVKARRLADGQWNLPEKFVVGVQEFCGMWPGKVEVYLPAADSIGNDLDYRLWHESELPCRFEFFDARERNPGCVQSFTTHNRASAPAS